MQQLSTGIGPVLDNITREAFFSPIFAGLVTGVLAMIRSITCRWYAPVVDQRIKMPLF